MPIRSSLNSKIRSFFLLFGLVIFFYIILPKANEITTLYHSSQWNEYAPEVVDAVKTFQPVELKHVYGMVLPHHIPTTIPRLVEYYGRLKATQTVKNFIIIGPDHTDAGKNFVTTSKASFFTSFGELKPIPGLAETLQDLKLASIEEAPFDPEHSIGAQMLIISKIFPESRVTPIIVNSHTPSAQAEALGKKLAELADEETVIVASVDFSHYLSTTQAAPIDRTSGEVVKNLDLNSLKLIKADSNHSMEIFMHAMADIKAYDTDAFQVLNTNDLVDNADYTTGYVFGFWGMK
jgi:MEMO1 family protein